MIDKSVKSVPEGLRKLEQFVFGISDLLFQVRLYPPGHDFTQKLYRKMHLNLQAIIGRSPNIVFRVIGGSIYYMNFRIDVEKRYCKGINLFREAIEKMSIREIEIKADIEKGEIKAFLEICLAAVERDKYADLGSKWRAIRNIKIRNINKKRVIVPDKTVSYAYFGKMDADDCNTGVEVKGKIGEVLTKLNKLESSQRRVAGKKVLELISEFDKDYYAILLLKSLKSFDTYTFNHSVNVAVISAAIASRAGYSEDVISTIGLAGLLHDVGKLCIPRDILHKPGGLTPTEWLYVKRHPAEGAKILREEGGCSYVQRVAYEHHIGYNMSGYPNVGKNRKLLDASFIVQIADTYDALTTKRPYRKQLNPFEAVRSMQNMRGEQFHPHFMDLFMTVLGNLPIGKLVQLDNDETAVIVDTDDGTGNFPSVRVIRDSNGFEVSKNTLIDLNEKNPNTGKYSRSIKNVLDTPFRDIDIGKYTHGKKSYQP
ncbi:MAG: HD domain-containing protein [Candidatus Krumholzibacteriota bacterium]|nr:HD domain-containing protein [Candidatus Krumholzibacteriota bacterium]